MTEQNPRPANGLGILNARTGMALAAVIAAVIAIGASWSWFAAALSAPLLFYLLFCGAMLGALLLCVRSQR